MPSVRSVCVVAVAAMLAAAPLAAQRASPHQGFWVGFGVGGGSDLSDQARDARAGGAVYLRLGGTVNPMLLVGGELSGWGREQNNTTVGRGSATATIYFYPVSRGFFLKSGLGFASRTIAATSGVATVSITDEGFGAIVGGGYDVQIGRNLFLVPNLDFLFQVINDETDVIALLTIGLTWH